MTDTNYELKITGFTTLTFPLTPEFFPSLGSTWKRDGKQMKVDDTIPIHGWFSENSFPALQARIDALHALNLNGAPVKVEFIETLSATTVYTVNRGHMINLREEKSDGSRSNHLEFTFEISEERAVTVAGLVDITFEDTEDTTPDADGIMRTIDTRTVTATGQFGNLSAARNFVLARAPSGKITSRKTRAVQFDGFFSATWTVDATDEKNAEEGRGKIYRWVERVTLNPGSFNVSWKRRGNAAPLPIRGGFGESRLNVSGQITVGDDPNQLPFANEIIQRFFARVTGNGKILTAPSFGAAFPEKFDAEDKDLPIEWSQQYSFVIEFGEAPGNPLPASAAAIPGGRFDSFGEAPIEGAGAGAGGEPAPEGEEPQVGDGLP